MAAIALPLLQACGDDDDSEQVTSSPAADEPEDGAHVIKMGGPGGELSFFPDRLQIQPGEAVRWEVQSAGHSATAYHPDNHNLYESRIPEDAEPWDSGVLTNVGESFEHRFESEGVYQYYCIPHEGSGMVGSIVVGRAVEGPGTAAVQPEVPAAAKSKLEELITWANGL